MSQDLLNNLLGADEANSFVAELKGFWEQKTEGEQVELKAAAQRLLLGDLKAADEINVLLYGNTPRPKSVAVGLIVVGIGIMLLWAAG